MKRVADLADSVREARPGRVLLLAGGRSERGLVVQSLADQLRYLRVDLAAVIAKYIGETEKNLSRLLAPIDNQASILFFDEADALFGRRTDVKDTHDRCADILRAFRSARGLVVLGVDRPDRVPPILREIAQIVPADEYSPPR